MRTNLKLFRVKKRFSQEEFAACIGCTRATYSSIESGSRDGRFVFWRDLQAAFGIPDAEMWAVIKNDED